MSGTDTYLLSSINMGKVEDECVNSLYLCLIYWLHRHDRRLSTRQCWLNLSSHQKYFKMLTREIIRRSLPALSQSIRFESISVGAVRAGMILKLDGNYVEVKKYEPKREGRGGAMGAVCNQKLFVTVSPDRIR